MKKISRKLVAIGGGEIGRPGYPIETEPIDREIIRLSGKKHPKLLFVPTASRDAAGYIETVRAYFGKKLGCRVSVLLAAESKPSRENLWRQIANADIIYVGGGNTLYMMKRWRKLGIDKLLRKAFVNGTVMAGLSAGAICWFTHGCSDSRKITGSKDSNYVRVRGLGWLKAAVSPHHIREPDRNRALELMIKKYGGIGLAMDDYAAIEVVDNNFRIITSKPGSKVRKVFVRNGKVVFEPIPKNTYLPISDIYQNLK